MTQPVYDEKTMEYFDKNVTNYNSTNQYLQEVLDLIKANTNEETTLIDIGCGNGSNLTFIKNNTNIKNLYGIDISNSYLEIVKEKGFEAIKGSILDDNIAKESEGKFDFVILSLVLHHLVGNTKAQSNENVKKALKNASLYLKPGGHLIICETTYESAFATALIFYIKKLVCSFTNNRIELLGKLSNIGAPLVNLFTPNQLLKLVQTVDNLQLVEKKILKFKFNILVKLFYRNRYSVSIVYQKNK